MSDKELVKGLFLEVVKDPEPTLKSRKGTL